MTYGRTEFTFKGKSMQIVQTKKVTFLFRKGSKSLVSRVSFILQWVSWFVSYTELSDFPN